MRNRPRQKFKRIMKTGTDYELLIIFRPEFSQRRLGSEERQILLTTITHLLPLLELQGARCLLKEDESIFQEGPNIKKFES